MKLILVKLMNEGYIKAGPGLKWNGKGKQGELIYLFVGQGDALRNNYFDPQKNIHHQVTNPEELFVVPAVANLFSSLLLKTNPRRKRHCYLKVLTVIHLLLLYQHQHWTLPRLHTAILDLKMCDLWRRPKEFVLRTRVALRELQALRAAILPRTCSYLIFKVPV